jgi:hypothetical protein
MHAKECMCVLMLGWILLRKMLYQCADMILLCSNNYSTKAYVRVMSHKIYTSLFLGPYL